MKTNSKYFCKRGNLIPLYNYVKAYFLLFQAEYFFFLQHAEWEQFQTDLLMTVRVANNFKVEAQEQIEQLKVENEGLKNYVMDLECKVNQMKGSIFVKI